MAKADLTIGNVIPNGGKLFKGNYTTTAGITSKVIDNSRERRERITFYCNSTQSGTWVIYDIDEDGDYLQITSIAVTANILNIYTHNHVCMMAFSIFTPSAAPGTESLTLRAYAAGWGARS